MRSFMIICMVWLSAALARADVFVIAPPYYEGSDGRAVSDEIARLIEEDLGTQHLVTGPRKAALLVAQEHRVSCPEGDCAERYREAAGAVAAVVIRVGRGDAGAGTATSFQLGIQPSPGVEYTQGALLSDGPLRELVVRALREAMRDYRQGPGPWLEITGAPLSASVFIDDRSAGTLPWTDTLPLGSHRVRVEARGFEPMTKIVSLASPTERKKLEFRLEPARVGAVSTAADVPPNRQGEDKPTKSGPRRTARLVGITGAAMLVLGAPLLGLAIRDKVREGDCLDPRGSLCRDTYAFGTASKTLLGVGLPLTVLGTAAVVTSFVYTRKSKTWQFGADVRADGLGATIRGDL